MDSTVIAIPVYFGTMGAEYWWLRRNADKRGPTPADYTKPDTLASLTMGVASLLAPMIAPRLVGPVTPGKGKYAKVLLATAAGAAAVTTIADVVARMTADDDQAGTTADADPTDVQADMNRERRRRIGSAARQVAGIGGVAAIAAGGLAITTTWASRLSVDRLWNKRVVNDLGTGPLAWAVAIFGWDFIYYWNHRFMHEARYLWAIHVVHHSSEHYNLSTALRQPVADVLGTFAPYGALGLIGVRPDLISQARGINLLYQYWIHTDVIRSLGPLEKVLNTASHHRVHHGSNPQYLDRNHGSILIVWDRLFGTFEPEDEPVVYGLTKNIDTYDPLRIASHEHVDMMRDVKTSTTWRERLSFVMRGPGWAYRRHAERATATSAAPVAA